MDKSQTKKPWATLSVTHVGHVANVVKGGGGKLSATTGDPGEPLKVPGNDGR